MANSSFKKKIKFTKAVLKVADYNGDFEADKAALTNIGYLEGGMNIEMDQKIVESNIYGVNGKIHSDRYIESAKVTTTLAEITASKLASVTGFFKKTVNVDSTETYTLDFSALQDKMLAIEETAYNIADEKLVYYFYPVQFTGKLEIKYEADKPTNVPLEFTVYADINDPDGNIGMKFDRIPKPVA